LFIPDKKVHVLGNGLFETDAWELRCENKRSIDFQVDYTCSEKLYREKYIS
jgi:hypothetical protein